MDVTSPTKSFSVLLYIPVFISPDPSSQLDIYRLQGDMPGMDCKEVCILQKGDEVVLRCFMQCINCSHCPPGNKTPFFFCITQLFRINSRHFLHMPPLSDADVLDHPGINTCILNIFDVFDICANNYNTCIFYNL